MKNYHELREEQDIDKAKRRKKNFPKCPPGYVFSKSRMDCIPITENDRVSGRVYGNNREDEFGGGHYTVWGQTGVNGDGYAYEEPPKRDMNRSNWSRYMGTQVVGEEETRWRDVRRKTLDRAEFHRRRGDTERANKIQSIATSHDQGQTVEAKRKAKGIRLSGETGTLSPAAASDKRGAIDVRRSLPEDFGTPSDWRTEVMEERKACPVGKRYSKKKKKCVKRRFARRSEFVGRPVIGLFAVGGRGHSHHHHDHDHGDDNKGPGVSKGNGGGLPQSTNGGGSGGGAGAGDSMSEGLVLRQSSKGKGRLRRPVQHGGDSGRLSPTNPPMGNGNTGLPNAMGTRIYEMNAGDSISVSDKTSKQARNSSALKFRRENKFKQYQARQSGQNNLRLGENCGSCGAGGGGGMTAGDGGFTDDADPMGPVAGFDPVMDGSKKKKKGAFCPRCMSRNCRCYDPVNENNYF